MLTLFYYRTAGSSATAVLKVLVRSAELLLYSSSSRAAAHAIKALAFFFDKFAACCCYCSCFGVDWLSFSCARCMWGVALNAASFAFPGSRALLVGIDFHTRGHPAPSQTFFLYVLDLQQLV